MQIAAAKNCSTKQKISILGGGPAALSAAFEITESPNWEEKYEITVHQLGWRLGGKCATGRGPNERIQEHGIHGFLGSYYNALPLMKRVFDALDREPGTPMATFEEAFVPENFVLMWEFRDGNWLKWPLMMPANGLKPGDPGEIQTLETIYRDMATLLASLFEGPLTEAEKAGSPHAAPLRENLKKTSETLLGHVAERAWAAVHKVCDEARMGFLKGVLAAIEHSGGGNPNAGDFDNATLRRLYIAIDYFLALMRGAIADKVFAKGFDHLDEENFDVWLRRHGCHDVTISSPMALNTPNLSYQYPHGDTSQPPNMAAGAYLHWTLRSFAFMGSFAYLFEVGTGETLISPMYDALVKRGVKFEFFNKVTDVRLSADGKSIGEVDIDIQATLAKGVDEYQPLIPTTPPVLNGGTIMAWPPMPLYDQLEQGEQMKKEGVDLESYWSPWKAAGQKTLKKGEDFDIAIYAIPVATIPHLCPSLLEDSAPNATVWNNMCTGVTTTQTQTMQIWLSKSRQELGLDFGLEEPNTVIGATFAGPLNGHVDLAQLVKWEKFPADQTPKSLWYFSGTMTDYTTDAPPPFSDHDYPRRAHERVKHQCVQWLQATMGSLMSKSTVDGQQPPGDPMSLDFDLMICTEDNNAKGVARFDQQFWRANIDPNERYTQSIAGSTKFRVKAWETGYDNLVIAGDWCYTGLNVGSMEGTIMSGRLAAHAVTGFPKLEDIPGFLHTSL